ncbi:MAG: nitrilase-related carbon-nitrogen hydrolase, partial [Chitinophagales bacterium]
MANTNRENLLLATAQFEHRSGDKEYNLEIIAELSASAAKSGARAIAFHECSVTGYTFARKLSRPEMLDLAELIPGGKSIERLTGIARENDISVLAGLFEKDEAGNLYKAYVCVDKT